MIGAAASSCCTVVNVIGDMAQGLLTACTTKEDGKEERFVRIDVEHKPVLKAKIERPCRAAFLYRKKVVCDRPSEEGER